MSAREKPRPIRGNVYGSAGVGAILDVPRCSVYALLAMSIPNNTATAIPWDTPEYNIGMTSLGSRIICDTQGVYRFTAWLIWAANATGARILYFRVNGTGSIAYQPAPGVGVASDVGQNITADIPLVAGDYVEVVGVQTSGGPLGVYTPVLPDRWNGFQACLASTT